MSQVTQKSVIRFLLCVQKMHWCSVLINITSTADVNKYSAPDVNKYSAPSVDCIVAFQDGFAFHSKYVRLNYKDFFYYVFFFVKNR